MKPLRGDITGKKFNRLEVLSYAGISRCTSTYLCVCICGVKKVMSRQSIVDGKAKSCGCLAREVRRKISVTHGESKTRLNNIWFGMKYRCNSKRCPAYKNYGARGIKVCKEWMDYKKFAQWARENGYTNSLTIERINVNGNYEPTNCKWIPKSEQSRNTRNVTLVEYKGQMTMLKDIAKGTGINYTTLRWRLARGLTLLEALNHKKGKFYATN